MGLSTVGAFKHIHTEDGIILHDAQLAHLQATLLYMLGDIDACCKKHGLTFLLGGGSCLGAVRHGGFIPWDDDIDINMPRKDHDAFIRFFSLEYGDRYWVHTADQSKGYGLVFSRVLLKGTSVRTREDFHNDECGAFIDIFVMENTYDNFFLRWLHGVGALSLGLIQSCAKFYRDKKELLAMAHLIEDKKERRHYERIFRIKILLGALTSFRSLDAWTRTTDHWYARCKNQKSRFVTMPAGRLHFFGELYEREDLLPGVPAEYEGKRMLIPQNADQYLRRLYGEYHVLPSEDQKERHIFFSPFILPDATKPQASVSSGDRKEKTKE